jgi:carbon storage regulator
MLSGQKPIFLSQQKYGIIIALISVNLQRAPRRDPMLVITRKLEEKITIGNDITISILGIKGNHVKLGIEAPRNTPIYRTEVFKSIVEENLRAATVPQDVSLLSE